MSSSFRANAQRSGDWWAVEVVEGLDGDTLGVTQTRHLVDVECATRSVVSELTGLELTAIEVEVDLQ